MKRQDLLSLPWCVWAFSLGTHLAVFLGPILWLQARAAEVQPVEVELSWASSMPMGDRRGTVEEDWRKPELRRPRIPVLPVPRKEPEASIPEPPETTETSMGGDGESRTLAQVDRPPAYAQKVVPVYPEEARAANVQGTVILQVDIDATGAVKKVVLLKGLGYGCDEAAMEAARRTTFLPALQAGSPVPVTYPLTYRFDLDHP